MKGQGTSFQGKIAAELATISGTFTLMGKDVPLVLTRATGASK
jgi:hypothetical protein